MKTLRVGSLTALLDYVKKRQQQGFEKCSNSIWGQFTVFVEV